MLGQGRYTAYLYDRGGEKEIGKFEQIIELGWSRVLNGVSQAALTVSTPPNIPDCCAFYGNIRSMRHELMIFRNEQRIWEGPVIRVAYFPDRVEIQARDVLQWIARRVHRGRFSDPRNVVDEAYTCIDDALRYDDPNIYRWVTRTNAGGQSVRTAYNRADCYYLDALDDYTDKGLNYTAIGRKIHLWSASRQIGQTAILRSSEDFVGEISVIEDGLALATRGVTNGTGEEFGASTPEPEIINYALNPIPVGTFGYGGNRFFDLSAGRITAHPPNKPATLRARPVAPKLGSKGSLTDAQWQQKEDDFHQAKDAYEDDLKAWETDRDANSKAKRAFNQVNSDYNQSEVVLSMSRQRIAVHEGELLTATLLVRGFGTLGKLGLRLRPVLPPGSDDDDDDRGFGEGDPVKLSASTYREIRVTGTVPENATSAYIEVYRDTSIEWKTNGSGFQFQHFAFWRGRRETWFDPNSATTSTFDYGWVSGAVNASPSYRRYLPIWDVHTHPHPQKPKISPYYGIVESLDSVDETTRQALEAASRDHVSHSNPSPLAVDVPQGMPLSANAQVSVYELVAGTTVPVETVATCRQLRASTTLSEVEGRWTQQGETITVTLVSGRVFEIIDIESESLPDPPPERVLSVADREAGFERGE